MQVGMIGLGRMGANMARRLMRGGHECIVYDVSSDAVRELVREGALGAKSVDDLAARLALPRVVWIMLPAAVVDAMLADVITHLTDGDIVVASRQPVGAAAVGIQRADLTLHVARGRKRELEAWPVSEAFTLVPAAVPRGAPFFTAQLYARLRDSLRNGPPLAPDFGAAVRRHRLLDAIQTASDTGIRQRL